MKSGIIDIFVDAFGWVLGKAGLFVLAILTGLSVGASGLWAGTMMAGGSFGFQAEKPIFEHLTWVSAILPQVLLMFWAGMVFVRSEAAEAKHWGQVAAMQALLLTVCCSGALPDGLFPRVVAWSIVLAGIAAVVAGLHGVEGWRQRRGEEHLARLEKMNALRREELKAKFGTVSVGARELGIL
jgi:vacuolar-type H+-ATPase subunit I/STV1